MKRIGLLFAGDPLEEATRQTVAALRAVCGGAFRVTLYGDEDTEDVLGAETDWEETDIPVLVLDAATDWYDWYYAIGYCFDHFRLPRFMIVNYQHCDRERMPYLYNVVGDCLLATERVMDPDSADWRQIFFSPENAFDKLMRSDIPGFAPLFAFLED